MSFSVSWIGIITISIIFIGKLKIKSIELFLMEKVVLFSLIKLDNSEINGYINSNNLK